jgi:hypothetical protein
MSDHISTDKGFMDHFVESRVDADGFLSQVDRLMDWSPLEKLLKKHYKKVAAADGRPAYPALTMFKILLMQRWYSLSDAGMEEARGLKNGTWRRLEGTIPSRREPGRATCSSASFGTWWNKDLGRSNVGTASAGRAIWGG